MAIIGKSDKSLKAGKPVADLAVAGVARLMPGMTDFLAGESKDFIGTLTPYLPQELIGGVLPYIVGHEEEAVWNAASQACGTEKVHFCYSIDDKKVWYLACPSSSLASNPNSWCPLAAALPGNSEYWDRETVYLYEHEGLASALRWDPETGRMQVFLGAARTILPRIQSMDANFVTVNPAAAKSVPWKSRTLKTEKMARATVRLLILSGMLLSILAVLVLVFNFVSINLLQRNLGKVQRDTEKASNDLTLQAYNAMQSDTIKHMVRIQEILDGLSKVDGTLVRYEVNENKVEWEALVPPAFAQDFGAAQGLEKDGRVRIKNNR
ncbi:MAG: hypothetical protein ACT4OY_00690 [Alphaproteobacteria bacterium]